MAKKEKHTEATAAYYGQTLEEANAVLPPPADPQPNGDPVQPAQPASTPKAEEDMTDQEYYHHYGVRRRKPRRPRDPNAPRPLYLLIAVDNDTQRVRLLGTAPTVGQASKLVPAMSYGIERGESGPMILRCKLVSAVGRRTRKAS